MARICFARHFFGSSPKHRGMQRGYSTERDQVHFPTTRCGAGLPVAEENTAAQDPACAIARLMQQLGRNYVGQFNARHHRTGTLRKGRYKACLVDSESHVPRCLRYIDLNPVRARITDDATAYPWSSAAAHAGLRNDALLKPHPAYANLGSTPEARTEAYRHLLCTALADDALAAIRNYLQQQRALGHDEFRAMVEAKTQRFAGVRAAHRPARGAVESRK